MRRLDWAPAWRGVPHIHTYTARTEKDTLAKPRANSGGSPLESNRNDDMAPDLGMLVLRKACRNCTRSKRRCVVGLPKCERCRIRNLACGYDREPLVAQRTKSVAVEAPSAVALLAAADYEYQDATVCPLTRRGRLSPHHRARIEAEICKGSLCWLELAASGSKYVKQIVLIRMDKGLMEQTPTYPAMQITVDNDTEQYMIGQLLGIPTCAARGQINAFIHPKLRMRRVLNHVNVILASRHDGGAAIRRRFCELIDTTNIACEDLEGALAAVQSLMLYLIIALGDLDETRRAWGEGLLPLLRSWIELLLASAQDKMPQGLTSWQAWLLAESVRRTIIVGFIIGCAYQHLRMGFIWHKLFVESLPFDARPGLWCACSSEEWCALVGEDVCERLTSFHDFSVSNTHESDSKVDPFARLILVAHHGRRRVIDGPE